jgi:protein-disulfide isomerase
MRKMLKTFGLITAALLSAGVLSAAPPSAKKPAPKLASTLANSNGAKTNWNAVVSRTPLDSHLLGNPAAPVKLIAYVSYTCSHCAQFEVESDAQLRIGMIGPGKGSIEVRNFVRDPVDLTVALLTHCGPVSKFFANHSTFLRHQPTWLGTVERLSDGQRQRWASPDFATRTRAIASDLGLYTLMEARGYDRPALDRCLADRALADRLAKNTKEAGEKDFVTGTPSFVLGGIPLSGTHSWASLKPQIEARLP